MYDLIGYLEHWDPSKAPKCKSKFATIKTTTTSISIAITELSPLDVAALHITYLPDKSFGNSPTIGSCACIIDSGSNDYMYFDTSSVSTLKPSKQYFVSTINGTKDNVIGKYSISLDKLNFDYVLIFISLNFNQIIVTQITLSLNCIVIF